MMVIITSLVMALVVAGLLGERYARIRHLGLLTAPLAFLGLLYPLLMPIRFEEAESILVEYPFLGIHVVLTLLGHVGFALAFCSAVGLPRPTPSPEKGPAQQLSARARHGCRGDLSLCRRGLFALYLGFGHGRDLALWCAGRIPRGRGYQNLAGSADVVRLWYLSLFARHWPPARSPSQVAGDCGGLCWG